MFMTTLAEHGREQQQLAVAARELGAPALEFAAIEHADARTRQEHVQVMAQPLAVAHVIVDDQHAGRSVHDLRAHRCMAKRRRTRARWLTACPSRITGW